MKIKLNDIYTYLRSNDPNYVKYCKIKDNPYYLSLKSDDEEIYNNYVNTLPSSHRNRPTGTLKGLKDLIKKILNTDPAKRFTVKDIRNHEWYL